MRQSGTRIFALLIFVMTQVLGSFLPAQPARQSDRQCNLPCCASCGTEDCHCTAPPKAPPEPVPAAPLSPPLEVKFMAVPVNFSLPPAFRPPSVLQPDLSVTSEWVEPHSPPPLRLFCSLLI